MTKLKESGILKRIGTDRKGYWAITDSKNNTADKL
jgi:hypothetical protein